ncbi:MAG: uracil-DNA glycosylase family protein [Chloroflexota bacterium]
MNALETVHANMRQCRLCFEAGYDIVPGAVVRGVMSAEVLLIGQAPGVTEVETKRPFNAGSGRRLFQWLSAAGWEEQTFRETQYMTAVTKCYPGKHPSGKGDRVPSKAEQRLCRPNLEQEIRLVQPRLMILVGGLAIKLLYPKSYRLNQIIGTAVYYPYTSLKDPLNFSFSEGQLQQRFDPSLDKNGRWVVPLPHPSGASLWPNKPENKALIQKAIELLDAWRQMN